MVIARTWIVAAIAAVAFAGFAHAQDSLDPRAGRSSSAPI
jgi:hypothetical protein